MLLAWTVGKWMGRLLPIEHDGEDPSEKFDDAAIMLLSLLLAFAFGTSISKRKTLPVDQSQSVETVSQVQIHFPPLSP